MKAGVSQQRFPSIFQFSVLPTALIIYFISERQAIGDGNLNRFSYKNPRLDEISLFKDGVPLFQNERTNSLDIGRNSADTAYLYESFLQCFGDSAYDISIERFEFDLFMVCYNMTPSVILRNDKLITNTSEERHLNPISAGILDCEVKLKAALPENILIYFCSVGDALVKFDQNGIPIET